MPVPWFRLHYQETHFRFEWDSPQADVFALDEHGLRELENLYQDWLSAVQPRPWFEPERQAVLDRTDKLRTRMTALAPPEIRSWFRDFPVVLADDRSGLPWEQLCQQTVLRRKLGPSGQDFRLNAPLRGLALVDPDGTLPWTGQAEIPNLSRLERGRAGWQQLIEEGGEADWLWLSAAEVRGQLVLGNSLLGFEDALCRALGATLLPELLSSPIFCRHWICSNWTQGRGPTLGIFVV